MYFQKPDNYNILLKHPKISKKSPLFDKFNLPKSPMNINGKKNQLNISAVNQSFSHQIQPKSREESFSPIMYIRGNSNGYTGNTINTLMTQPNNNNDILAENRLNSDAGLPLIQPYKEKLTNQYIEQNYINNLTQQQKVYNQYQSQPSSNSQNLSLEKEKTVNYNLIKLSDLNTNHYKIKGSQSHQKNSALVNKKYVAQSNNNKINTNYDNNLNVISSTAQAAGNNQNILQKQQKTNVISNINTNRNSIHPSSTTQAVEEVIKNGSLVQNSNQINKQNSISNPNSNFQSKADLQKIEATPLIQLEQNATFSQKQIETHLYSQGDILLSQIDLEPLGGNDNKKYNSQMGSFNNFDDQLTIFNKDKLFLNQNNTNLSMKGSTLNIQFMNNSYNNADLLSINNDILSVCNDKLSLYETASQGNTVYLNNNNILNQNDSSSFLTRSMCDNCTLPHVNMLSQVSDGLDSSTLPSSIHYANYLQNNLIQRRKNSKQISDDLLGNSNSHNSTTLDEAKPQQIFSAFPQQRRNSFRKRNVYSVHQPHHNYQQAPQQYNQCQIQSDRRHNNNQRLETTAQFQQIDQKERITKDKQHMKLSEVVNRAGEVLNTKYLQEEIIIDMNDKKNKPIEKQAKSSENSFQDKNFSFFQAQQQNEKQQSSKQALKDKASLQQNQQSQQKQQKIKETSKSAHQTPKNVNDLNLQIFSSGVNSSLNSRRNISPPKVLPVIQIEKENDHSSNRIELDFQKQKKQTTQDEQQITKFKGRRFKSIDNQKTNNQLSNNTSSYQPSPFEIEHKNNEK
ncbi:hypothetical protein ABPG74_001377 [Tetrahymena malaccensis]